MDKKRLKIEWNKTNFIWMSDRIRGLKRYIVFLIIGNILFAGSLVLFSLACKELIDGAVSSNMDKIRVSALLLFGLILLKLLLRLSVNSLNEYVRARLTNRLRQDTLQQLLKKDYSQIKKYHSGELVNRMFSDVQIIVEGIVGVFPPIANMFTRLLGAGLILMRLDSTFTVCFLAIGCIAFAITQLFRNKIKNLHKDVQAKEGKVHSFLQETIENIRLIKASGLETHMQGSALEYQEDHLKAQMHRRSYTIVSSAGMSFIFQMGYLYALVFGGLKISAGMMSYGTLTAILQLIGQIQTPFSSMSGVLQKIYGMVSSAERLKELFELPDESGHMNDCVSDCRGMQELQRIFFDNVSFSYEDGVEVLKDLNFEVNQGDFVAVTGLSGGGKSTLFLLLLGIYQPMAGHIYMEYKNGERKVINSSLRSYFSYVPQGNCLFSGTIRENITLFCKDASEEQIFKAIQTACADEFIKEMPDGLETRIGERALGLSEGQAQRIAIARALLSGAPILLLDEATSALDAKTEKQLLHNISQLTGMTCLIVTHREAVHWICNRHIHIENGEAEKREFV